jgi:hypothetical protein
VFQYTRKNNAGTFKFKQVVPNLSWEVVPSPVVEVSRQQQQQQQQQQTRTASWRQLCISSSRSSSSKGSPGTTVADDVSPSI